MGLPHGEQMLAASVAALVLGPLLYVIARRARPLFELIDGFVLVAVLGLALLEIIPNGLEKAGPWALLAVVVGVLAPRAFARGLDGGSSRRAWAFIALLGMAVHAFTDGLAVAGTHHVDESHALEWAIILHRIPVGLAIWWMLASRPEDGQRSALVALGTIAAASVAGFYGGGALIEHSGGPALGLLEAAVGGLLLHVVAHRPDTGGSERGDRPVLAGIGALLGLGLVLVLFVVPRTDGHDHGAFGGETLWRLLIESAPALLIAYAIAGVLGEVLGEAPARWLRKGSPAGQALRGVVFGLPLPLCSCGVVPVYRSLVARRVPATAALAFLVATPELGIDAVLLSLPLLGAELALTRVVVAFVLALVIGWVVGGWAERLATRAAGGLALRQPPATDEHAHRHEQRPLGRRLLRGLRSGYGQVLDETGPWILVGLLLAALIEPAIDKSTLAGLDPRVQVLAFALLGMPVYVCASGATPLVAVLLASGLSPGAAIAFLLTGPATNVTTFGVIDRAHGRKIALAFAGTMLAAVVLLGFGVDALWSWLELPIAGSEAAHQHEGTSLPAKLAAFALIGLFALSLLRQGPRRFLARLWERSSTPEEATTCSPASEESPSCSGCCKESS